MPAWGVVSLLMIVGLAVANVWLWGRVDRLEVATAPGGMRAVPLTATGAAPEASGFVIIGADGRNGALIVDRLPALGSDREYQLWLIRDGERTSGAVFDTDDSHYRGQRITAPVSLFEYAAVSITIEPAGGSPQPTGDEVLGGPLFNP
jgi:anti-sigma-K factor RskA